MDVLFNFATKNRPDKFFACLDNIRQFSGGLPYKVAVKIDNDDLSDYSRLSEYPECEVFKGVSNNKIHAINRDIPKFDILFNHSDDMWFVSEWKRVIYDVFNDCCLHYPDGNRLDLMTYSIMDWAYYNRFGYVYHPDYSSLWCDNEAQQVAKMLERYKYIPVQMFEHRHPAFKKAAYDEQYRKTESYFYDDKAVFERRKLINFDL